MAMDLVRRFLGVGPAANWKWSDHLEPTRARRPLDDRPYPLIRPHTTRVPIHRIHPSTGTVAMSRQSYARTRASAARVRPLIQGFAVMATCAAAAWAGSLV
ncbi:MAG: hypothetical protein KY467_03795 [Gemmatimonadetes bacterium]|nr:hypothetical protein [Gemmatimonadota bacterium]